MWFKLAYSLQDLHVSRETDLPVEVEVHQDLRVALWIRKTRLHGRVQCTLCCSAQTQRAPPRRAAEALKGLEERRVIIDDPPQIELPYYWGDDLLIDIHGNIMTKMTLPLQMMSRSLVNFLGEVKNDLGRSIRLFVTAMRWRQGASGPPWPYRSLDLSYLSYSNDGVTWRAVPPITSTRHVSLIPLDLSPGMLTAIVQLLNSGASEPIAHELIREADDLKQTAPRSSLLVAMSALEAGLKEYTAHFVPDAYEILEKLPSPPIVTIVQEILPALHKRKNIQSEWIPLDRRRADFLKKWVLLRNNVAHGVKSSIDCGDLSNLIEFVKYILYILDYHRGNGWARDRIMSEPTEKD